MQYPCEKCGKRFPKHQGLRRHLARKRPCDVEDEPVVVAAPLQYTCNQCGFVFAAEHTLNEHIAAGCVGAPLAAPPVDEENLRALVRRLQMAQARMQSEIDELRQLITEKDHVP